jgi:hypothetical protein
LRKDEKQHIELVRIKIILNGCDGMSDKERERATEMYKKSENRKRKFVIQFIMRFFMFFFPLLSFAVPSTKDLFPCEKRTLESSKL